MVRILLWTALVAFAAVAGYVQGVAENPSSEAYSVSGPSASPSVSELTVRKSDSYAEEFERLSSLGYLPGYEPAKATTGVLHHEPDRVQPGYNLFTSGHAPAAMLMDMDGNVLYEWEYPFEALWPDRELENQYHEFWRRAHVSPNGDVIAIFENHGILKVNAQSELLWAYECEAHHDLFVDDRGHIFTLARDTVAIERDGMKRPVYEEYVLELSPEGEELSRISILEAVRRSDYRPVLEVRPWFWDMLHTNSLKPLVAGALPAHDAFRPGRILLSIRELNGVAVLDLETERIEWALHGMWFRQHEATLVDPGNLLVFDNRGHNKRSRVIEVDPVTHEVVWEYGLGENESLYSATGAGAERLENGNTLIVESNAGRVIEVTREKDVVWEFVNPYIVSDDRELTATVWSCTRLPSDYASGWLADASATRLARAR